MKKSGFITNKYTLSVLILLSLFITDILLHRGISRVMIPSSFSNKISPATLPLCSGRLLPKNKNWIKAVNNIELMKKVPANTAGIECDVYFDLAKTHFEVYHDSAAPATLDADSLLAVYALKKLSANIWFDFKNLDGQNALPALNELNRLKNKFGLAGQVIVESSSPEFLKPFCDSGFFTSYYVPFFNPYSASEGEIIAFTDSVRNKLTQYPASAVSGYYYQYPALKKFFPNYPILTWVDNTSFSVVSYVFKRQLEQDESIRVILFPFNE